MLYLIVIFFSSIFLIFKIYGDTKAYIGFKNIPSLELPLLGMYVKFRGKVYSENECLTPIGKIACAYYKFSANALYSVKAKSPKRGYEEIAKPIYKESSKNKILIHQAPKIYLEITEDTSIEKNISLNINTNTEKRNEPILYYGRYFKATSYTYIERYLTKGDDIIVYGRLIKEDDYYIIKNTYSQKLPFGIYLYKEDLGLIKSTKNKILFYILKFCAGVSILLYVYYLFATY